MSASVPESSALVPLAYHRAVASYLADNEAEVWSWASGRCGSSDQAHDSLRSALLRDTYRLDSRAHAQAHEILATAMQRLGIVAPATLYQSPGQGMNAMLVYVPEEVHIIVQGPLLEHLTTDELLAVFGHELAHHALWSCEAGRYYIADRILNDAVNGGSAAPSIYETYRRFVLHTEVYADRGGAIAAGALEPAVTALVKVYTGIRQVDPAAYLRQAQEVETSEREASSEHSHPETFIRARALALWCGGADGMEDWLAARLVGPLVLTGLDLMGQVRLQALTRGFIARFLTDGQFASPAVLAQVRQLFPDWNDGGEAAASLEAFGPDAVDAGVRDYLVALMMDLALADADQRDEALLWAGRLARKLGCTDTLERALQRDAGFGRRELTRHRRALERESQA